MIETVYVVGFNVAVACAFGRVGGIVVGTLRSLAKRKRFQVVRFGAIEAITWLEPPVLAITTYMLLVNRDSPSSVSGAEATASVAGGLVALVGLALMIWTLLSWRELFVGHAVVAGQQLVTGGAYGLVRHPVYLGALLIWGGLSLCFLSLPAALIGAIYVTPAYLLYIRSEEKMMLQSFGEQYRRYRQEVPMLVPLHRSPHA
jgi:protein-S-isoprenylcysteine O-methyltransferase Ste14